MREVRAEPGPRGPHDDRSTRVRLALAASLVLMLLVSAFVSGAFAQVETPIVAEDPASALPEDSQAALADPGETCAEQTESVNQEAIGCDTKYTPIAKEGEGIGWTQIAGAIHRDAVAPANYDNTVQNLRSPIPPTVDFYTVSFANADNGFAGGAECREDAPERQKDEQGNFTESNAAYQERITPFLNECVRVPVIYRFTDSEELGPIWQQAYKGTTPGFVGAVTWLHNQDKFVHGPKALAVGGTGSPSPECPKADPDGKPRTDCPGYPRREPAIPDPVAEQCRAQATPAPDAGNPAKAATDLINPATEPQAKYASCEDAWRRAQDAGSGTGKGRAWLFTDGNWRSLGIAGDGLPQKMRGLTALDASLDPTDCASATSASGTNPKECAMAGGLQQLWMWTERGFDATPWEPAAYAERSDRAVPNDRKTVSSTGWRFRVRQIRFRPKPDSNSVVANAITAGCCTTHPNDDMQSPRVLRYSRGASAGWGLDPLVAYPRISSDCLAGATGDRPVCGRRRLPDSFYAFVNFGDRSGFPSFLVTPGGPERLGEPPAQIIRGGQGDPLGRDVISPGNIIGVPEGVPSDVLAHWASSARLVAGDGDFQDHRLSLHERLAGVSLAYQRHDGYIDWAVGGFKGSLRAIAYTTTTQQTFSPGNVDGPFPLSCPGGLFEGNTNADTLQNGAAECKPNDKAPEQAKSGYLFHLSSYFLNAFTLAGESAEGWGVGDRGAIELLAGNDAAAGGTLQDESAPLLGAKRPAPAPPREPYGEAEPQPDAEPGILPPRAARELERRDQPEITPYGSANPTGEPIDQIAMSRDGSEGWAAGPPRLGTGSNGVIKPTLYRFDGFRWRRCPTDSVEGVMEADPACESLGPLRHSNQPARFRAMTRIPMENGSDPTEADEFEVIAAVSIPGQGMSGLLRYRDGRWAVDTSAARDLDGIEVSSPYTSGSNIDLAFSSPDDGWLIDGQNASGSSIWHFDGTGWTQCSRGLADNGNRGSSENPDTCADHNRLFPISHGNNESSTDAHWSWEDPPHLTSAGERVYLYANRRFGATTTASDYPMVLYKDPGPCHERGDPGCWQQAYDPGCVRQEQDPAHPAELKCVADSDPSKVGTIRSLSVARTPGGYNGWGLGNFGTDDLTAANLAVRQKDKGREETPLIHTQDPSGENWKPTQVGDAANDYLLRRKTTQSVALDGRVLGQVLALPDGGAIASGADGATPPVWLDPASGRSNVLPLRAGHIRFRWSTLADAALQADVATIAPDNAGGAWIADTAGSFSNNESLFYRFSKLVRPEVFDEVAHPVRERATAVAGGGDGSLWVATNSNAVYRYDRHTGWDRLAVPGWDPGRVVTRPSEANAIAIGADGFGVLVGKNGRIADLGPAGAVLDPAAGTLCSAPGGEPPCGSGRDLRAAAIAPDDGSAMVGGDSRALLHRRGANGSFEATNPPPMAVYATITGISMPSSGEAYLVTDTGQIWHGSGGGPWDWSQEDIDRFGDSLSRDERKKQQPLRAIAIDGQGHGYAVGARGTILERTGEGTPPWRRIGTEYLDELHSVALGPGGRGALIGGDNGLILTETGQGFEPARFADRYDPINRPIGTVGQVGISRVVGLALLPGYRDGQLEAWAASQNSAVSALLHYTSDPSEPLLDGNAARSSPLSDSQAPGAAALSFAAFGNSNCQYRTPQSCPELSGNSAANDVTARAVRDQILREAARPDGPDFALFSGDVGDIGPGQSQSNSLQSPNPTNTPLDDSPTIDRWRELVADPLIDAGIPLFGSVGARDIAFSTCTGVSCLHQARTGLSFAWRQSLAGMAAPWGAPGAPSASSHSGLSFEPVQTGGRRVEDPSGTNGAQDVPTKLEPGDTTVEDPSEDTLGGETVEDPTKAVGGTSVANNLTTPEGGVVGDQKIRESGVAGDQTLPTGGARTHYALDVVRDGKPLLRLVVLDTSLRSIAASDPNQNPIEEQLGWLEDALKRPAGERAIVLTNTPTYSYGPGAVGETLVEGTALESILMRNRVDLVVDGRLGWNALYWALAPGLHWPCPGDAYRAGPPPAVPDCHGAGSSEADKAVGDAQREAAEFAGDQAAPGALPFLIAHSAGGKFGPDGNALGSAADGFWRGYSVVHLDPETGKVQIEQRPVFDWIGIQPKSLADATHVVRPGKKLTLVGYGREPLGFDMPARYDEILSPAITHRFELLVADPDRPWMPKEDEGSSDNDSEYQSPASERLGEEDPCGPYLCLASSVGTIDDQSGVVRAGNGNYERTFAIAQLSVNERSATYPLVFEPRASYRPPKPTLPSLSLPPPPTAPSQPPQPGTPSVEPPPPPAIPNVESPLSIHPVIPPTPPVYGNASPIDLGLAPVAIVAPPPTVVLQPPNPVVQPAPPSGARREARQRQAATQKSGMASSAEQEAGSEQQGWDSAADGPPADQGSAATRRDGARGHSSATRRDAAAGARADRRPSFTPLASREQPSAWARDALIGGGLGIAALVLALGLSGARPTPRRRPPEVPAPAFNRAHRR